MMRLTERAAMAALGRLDPETAHGLALRALRAGLAPRASAAVSPKVSVRLLGHELPNPIGVAAGFDKNGVAIDGALAAGYGFVEVGAVTPLPQKGNPRPRLFRLRDSGAVINRFGFNNDGVEALAARLAARRGGGLVGVNLGANRDSPDRMADYVTLIRRLDGLAGFFTVNVSSPNTARLRDLQGAAALDELLARCLEAAEGRTPVLLKIAPDLGEAEIETAAEICLARGAAGVVATNTTTSREGVSGPHAGEAGGLSGRPLFEPSTAVLRRLAAASKGRLTLIGVGGVATAEQALAKIRAGATAVQLYTALAYEGVSLGARIARDLDQLLAEQGVARLEDLRGADLG